MLKKIITLVQNIWLQIWVASINKMDKILDNLIRKIPSPKISEDEQHKKYVQYWYETIGEIAKRLDYRGIVFTINKCKELDVYKKESNEFVVSIKLKHNVKGFVVIVHWGCRTNNVKSYPQTNTKIVETLVTAITAIYGE